jgi:leucyl-tRNA synthetase
MPQNLPQNQDLIVSTHKAIRDVTIAIENWQLNKMVSGIRELSNKIEDCVEKYDCLFAIKTLCILFNPVAPHLTEEMWQMLGETTILANQNWPQFDPTKLESTTVNLAIQINGKLRGVIIVAKNENEETIKTIALKENNIIMHIGDAKINKVIFVPNKIINFII